MKRVLSVIIETLNAISRLFEEYFVDKDDRNSYRFTKGYKMKKF